MRRLKKDKYGIGIKNHMRQHNVLKFAQRLERRKTVENVRKKPTKMLQNIHIKRTDKIEMADALPKQDQISHAKYDITTLVKFHLKDRNCDLWAR